MVDVVEAEIVGRDAAFVALHMKGIMFCKQYQ